MHSNGAERELLKILLSLSFNKVGLRASEKTGQRDLEFVCESIQHETAVSISVSTLKRLLRGEFNKLPQVATLNALASFSGFKNWNEFKLAQGKESIDIEQKRSKSGLSIKWKYSIVVVLVVLGAVLLISGLSGKNVKAIDSEVAEFSITMTSKNEIPNTVVFHYNIDDVPADSFFIQQSWDETRRVKISKNKYSVTDIYYTPGYHVAKLIADNQIIKTLDVSIPTDRWFFYAKDSFTDPVPEYIHTDKSISNGNLIISEEELINNRIEPRDQKIYGYTNFPSVIAVSADNYVLKTRVRAREVRNTLCPYLMIEVFCQRGFMFFRSTSKGCSGESFLQFGDNIVDGKDSDLSSLGYDIAQWMEVELVVKDKHVTIKLGESEVYSTEYSLSTGLITGVGFFSSGLCEVDYVELKGLDGQVVYQSDFGISSSSF